MSVGHAFQFPAITKQDACQRTQNDKRRYNVLILYLKTPTDWVGGVAMKTRFVVKNEQVLFFYGVGMDLKGAVLKGKETVCRTLFET